MNHPIEMENISTQVHSFVIELIIVTIIDCTKGAKQIETRRFNHSSNHKTMITQRAPIGLNWTEPENEGTDRPTNGPSGRNNKKQIMERALKQI